MTYTKGLSRFVASGLVVLWIVVGTVVPFHGVSTVQAGGSTSASRVLGQPDFTSKAPNNPALTNPASRLAAPTGLATDPASGRLFVVDSGNSRILSWPDAASFGNGQAADLVIGQQDFASTTANPGGVSAKTLSFPSAVAVDAYGNLYVADTYNHRALEYDAPLGNGMAAKRVFGQPDFSSKAANNGGNPSATSLDVPQGLTVDSKGNLYVADTFNNRVMEYDNPLTSDNEADQVFGQTDFLSNTANHGAPISASGIYRPSSVVVDAASNVFVADTSNNRVLEYDAPGDVIADHVFGQGGAFDTGTENKGGSPSADTLWAPVGLALDPAGNLYVADRANNRVLEFDNPLSNTTATRIIGQGSFATNTAGTSEATLSGPYAVLIDRSRNLLVADSFNNRVLEYNRPIANTLATILNLGPSRVTARGTAFTLVVNGSNFVYPAVVQWNGSDRTTTFISNSRLTASIPAADITNAGLASVTVVNPGTSASADQTIVLYNASPLDAQADRVLGQPNFTTSDQNSGALLPSAVFHSPLGLAIDPASGRLLMDDYANNRVLSWSEASSFSNGQPADLVLGQPNFYTFSKGTTATSLWDPEAVVVDALGRVLVTDTRNNRVVRYSPPFTNGMAADLVIGQPGFTSNTLNNGGLSASSLASPTGLAFDQQGNLYVSDLFNNRVLAYTAPLSNGIAASRVLGQPDFVSGLPNSGGVSVAGLKGPAGVGFDPSGHLYVADMGNHRVLEYDNPLTGDPAANQVFGQPTFDTGLSNNGGIGAASLSMPFGVAFDSAGDLYVADRGNHRVLEYDNPLTTDTVADHVFGQPDFKSNTANNGGLGTASLNSPSALLLDRNNNLLVADASNNRVLEYDRPLAIPYKVYLPGVLRSYSGGW